MVDWVRTLYASGARNFIMQNVCFSFTSVAQEVQFKLLTQMIPLELTILYSANSYPNRFWAVERNTSDWSVLMTELVLSGNALTKLMLQALAPTLPGSHIAIFDSHSLIQDIYDHPALYLNGTAPLNVTGAHPESLRYSLDNDILYRLLGLLHRTVRRRKPRLHGPERH
jgi:hypothetical protein